MKIFKFLVSLRIVLFFMSGISFGYEQYGFSNYQENGKNISFTCNNQCYLELGRKDKVDYLSLKGDVNGNGFIGYGFAIGNQISLLNQYEVILKGEMDDYMNFLNNKQYLSSIPGDVNLILLFNGNLNGNLDVKLGKFTFGQKISQLWKDFWQMETFTPYSINLRYGVILMGTSIIKYGYILFIIVAILILIFKKGKKEKKFKMIFYVGLGLFLFIGIRNVITYTSILNQGLNGFKEDKTYFDLGDYIAFTDKIRSELNLDSNNFSKDGCKIYINSFQYRPFTTHRENFYLKPCEHVLTGDIADYKIYYKTEVPAQDSNKKVLINFNNSYLLENN